MFDKIFSIFLWVLLIAEFSFGLLLGGAFLKMWLGEHLTLRNISDFSNIIVGIVVCASMAISYWRSRQK